MNRAVLDGIELEYEVRGAGEPVVLVHAGVLAGWFKPLMDEPALSRRYRLVRYHRIGYAGSSRIAGPVSLEDQAGHLRALMRHLGIERAHFVGHSSSGNIVLQAAMDTPPTLSTHSPSWSQHSSGCQAGRKWPKLSSCPPSSVTARGQGGGRRDLHAGSHRTGLPRSA